MPSSSLQQFCPGRWALARLVALVVVLAAAVTWLWAHEGHLPLPTRGALVDHATGQVNLSPDARTALDVQTAEARLEALDERLTARATLVAPWRCRAFVTTRLPGRVAAVRVQPGDTVTRGQALAEVESLELEGLQLDLLTARNDARLSGRNHEQLREITDRGAGSEQKLRAAQAAHRANLNAVEIARLKLLGLGFEGPALKRLLDTPGARPLSALPVTSPVSGVVSRADVRVGQVVDPSDHLFEVVDLSSVWVKVDLLEADLPRVQTGQPVEVRLAALPGQVFHAAVQGKGLSLDPKTRLGAAWTELSNPPGQPPRLLPGMYGQADVLFPAPGKAVTVPAAAVVSDGAERYVLVEEGPGQYVKQNVVIGHTARGRVELLAGQVVPGDRVVTRGSHELGGFFGQGAVRLSPQAARNVGLRVEPARPRVVAEVLELSGVVELPPARSSLVAALLPGTIRRIHADRDQLVRAGDVLAEVGGPAFQDLQLDLLRSHLRFELQEESLRRLRPLAGKEGVSTRLVRETQSAAVDARQRRDSARRKLLAAGLSADQVQAILQRRRPLDTFPVKAPRAGAVVRFLAALGHTVGAEHPLFEVHDLSRPLVRASVPERQLPAVRVGQRARIRLLADPAATVEGRVARSGQTIESADRALAVWVEPDDTTAQARAGWLPGMLARVTVVLDEPAPVLAVPRSAVLREGRQAYLFVRQRDGAFERRAVTLGRGDDRSVAVTAGLAEREPVAVGGVVGLQNAFAAVK